MGRGKQNRWEWCGRRDEGGPGARERAGTGRTCRATRSCRLCFGNERAGALGVPPVAAATTDGARPWAARSYVAADRLLSARPWPLILAAACMILCCSSHPSGFSSSTGAFANRKRSEEHTSELQSLMRISYAVFCLKKKQITLTIHKNTITLHNN